VCEAHDVSEGRACTALGLDRSTIRYRSRRPDDAGVRQRLRELAAIRRRFGYRRRHFLLCKEGLHMNQKQFRRLYREEGLAVRKRGGRKRALPVLSLAFKRVQQRIPIPIGKEAISIPRHRPSISAFPCLRATFCAPLLFMR
jgi:hypothetical protein